MTAISRHYSIWGVLRSPNGRGAASGVAGVLWSLNRALWDNVTPQLCYVSVGLTRNTILARFAYECPPTDVERELVSDVETLVIADFHHLFETDFEVVHRDPGTTRELEDGTHWWAYMRQEPNKG